MPRAGIALGSNLGDRRALLAAAIHQLRHIAVPGEPVLTASIYQTEPLLCPAGSPDFLNTVVEISFAGSAHELLENARQIEHALGRIRGTERNAPRTIDVDLLYFGEQQIADDELILPHPRISERLFVLQPLADIQPQRILPGHHLTVSELLHNLTRTEPPLVPIIDAPACSAIIVAAGSSRRMGFDKLAAEIHHLPVLRRSIEAFLTAQTIHSIIVVCPPERWELFHGMHFTKPVTRVDGGNDRQDSVAMGLAALPENTPLVAVHDGARPLVSPDDIDRCVHAAMQHRAATLARRATETMKRADAEDFSAEAISRENLWCMETPQVFELSLLRAAYHNVTAQHLQVTDEVSALQAIGVKVKFIESLHPNLKITTPADLALAEALLE